MRDPTEQPMVRARPIGQGRPRTSALAVVSLVLSVMLCCPPLGMVGAALGMIALRSVHASQGMLRGRRAANLAIVIGLVSGIGGSIAASYLSRAIDQRTRQGISHAVEQCVTSAQREQWPASREAFLDRVVDRGALSDADLAAFGLATLERYGALREFRIVSIVRGGSLLSPQLEVAGTFAFERRDVPGSAVVALVSTPADLFGVLLQQLRVHDAQEGVLALPAVATSQPPTTGPAEGTPAVRQSP